MGPLRYHDRDMNIGLRTRLFAWWYFAIATGFVLLAIRSWLGGEKILWIGLRFGIALGFLTLGILTWKSGTTRR